MSRNFDALKSPLQGFLGYHSRFTPPARWITFSGVPSTLANFPVLVKANGWQNIANGYDVHFQDSIGNELAFELDWYDNSTKSGAWWVQVPTLSSGTAIKALYGDASVTSDQSSPAAVWSGYANVFHFSSETDWDSSIGSYTANPSAGSVEFASCTLVQNSLTGYGLEFSATNTSTPAILAYSNSLSGVPKTLSFYMTQVSVPQLRLQSYTGNPYYGFLFRPSGFMAMAGGVQLSVTAAGNYAFSYGVSVNSSTVSWIWNGEVQDTSACSPGSLSWDSPGIQAMGSTSNRTVFVLDEIRVGTTFRTADWLLYEQLNLTQHDTYTNYSKEV